MTAGIAAPAYAGIPVTHRGMATSVTFVTGHEDPAKEATTGRLGRARACRRNDRALHGREDAAAHRRRARRRRDVAGHAGRRDAVGHVSARSARSSATLATLGDAIAREGLSAPVITVIGTVVALRDEIGWFDRRPLFGKRIVVTRARSQAASLSDRLAVAGAEVIEMPATRVEPVDPRAARRAHWTNLNRVRLDRSSRARTPSASSGTRCAPPGATRARSPA